MTDCPASFLNVPHVLPTHTPVEGVESSFCPHEDLRESLTERLQRLSFEIRRDCLRKSNKSWNRREEHFPNTQLARDSMSDQDRLKFLSKPKVERFCDEVCPGIENARLIEWTWWLDKSTTTRHHDASDESGAETTAVEGIKALDEQFESLVKEYQEMSRMPSRSLERGCSRMITRLGDKVTRASWRAFELSQFSTLDKRAVDQLSALPLDRAWKTVIWSRNQHLQYAVKVSNEFVADQWRRSYDRMLDTDACDPQGPEGLLSQELEVIFSAREGKPTRCPLRHFNLQIA